MFDFDDDEDDEDYEAELLEEQATEPEPTFDLSAKRFRHRYSSEFIFKPMPRIIAPSPLVISTIPTTYEEKDDSESDCLNIHGGVLIKNVLMAPSFYAIIFHPPDLIEGSSISIRVKTNSLDEEIQKVTNSEDVAFYQPLPTSSHLQSIIRTGIQHMNQLPLEPSPYESQPTT
eukprot:gene8657-10159_t